MTTVNKTELSPASRAATYAAFTTALNNIRPPVGVITDVNSLARNAVSILAKGVAIVASAMFGAMLTLINAIPSVIENIKHIKLDKDAKKGEGVVQNSIGVFQGTSLVALASLTAASSIMNLSNVAAPAAMATATAAVPIAFYGALLIHGANGLRMARNVATVLETKTEDTVKQYVDTLDSATKEKLTEAFNNPNADESKLGSVKRANFKMQMKSITHMVIAVLGIVAAVLAIVGTGGAAAPILFALSAVIWLTVDVQRFHNWIGDKCWNAFKTCVYQPVPNDYLNI